MPSNTTQKRATKSPEKLTKRVVRTARANIHHDGEEYAPGDEIDMSLAEAEALDQAGVLEPVKADDKKADEQPV